VTRSFVFATAEAQAELDALPLDVRASFERIVRLVQAFDLERISRVRYGRCGCGEETGLHAPYT
jgi:hypothetical protein